jgi:hypothetical protein
MLSKVVWGWDLGSVTTELFYTDGKQKKFHLSKPPPTAPAHDVSHFICGFHPDLDWDFSVDPNHIAEYNAVFMEHILLLFYSYPNLNDNELKQQIDEISKHMTWFVYQYYRIPQTLGFKYTDLFLKQQFLTKLDPEITSKFYYSYYCATYLVEDLKLEQNQIKIQLTLDANGDKIDEDCKNYISRIKKMGD